MLPTGYSLEKITDVDHPSWDKVDSVALDSGIGFDMPDETLRT